MPLSKRMINRMTTTRLLNAAVMPCEGNYRIQRIDRKLMAMLIQEAANDGKLQSYIGYPDCARLLSEMCEVEIPVSREQTPLEDGDILLIARLTYRLTDPTVKGRVPVTLDDYEFFYGEYHTLSSPNARYMGGDTVDVRIPL